MTTPFIQQLIESAFTESYTVAPERETPSLTLDTIRQAYDSIGYVVLYIDPATAERDSILAVPSSEYTTFGRYVMPSYIVAHPDTIKALIAKVKRQAPWVRFVRAGQQRQGMRVIDAVAWLKSGEIVMDKSMEGVS